MKKTFLILLLFAFAFMAKAQTGDTISGLTKPDPAIKSIPPFEDNQIFSAVMHEPDFPGGIEKFNEYIAQSVQNLKVDHYTGRIPIQFVVEKDGSLSNIKLLKNINDTYKEIILTIMKNCPKWNAGTQNSKLVRVRYTVQAIFP